MIMTNDDVRYAITLDFANDDATTNDAIALERLFASIASDDDDAIDDDVRATITRARTTTTWATFELSANTTRALYGALITSRYCDDDDAAEFVSDAYAI